MRLAAAAAVTMAVLVVAVPARAASGAPCPAGVGVDVWISPRAPVAGEPLTAIAVGRQGVPGAVVIQTPGGETPAAKLARHGGPPWSAVATIASAGAGRQRIEVRRDDVVVACREIEVEAAGRRATPEAPRVSWDRATEDLFAAWIEHLFDAPPDEALAFAALHEVLRDPARNFLYGHLGLDEDDHLVATPDCADLPYVLRAYFAWKLGLPVGWRPCNRGTATAPPRCGAPTIREPGGANAAAFAALMRQVEDGVQSGNARTALDDDATDFYPTALTRETIRPGTVYADPYGHTLVVVGWVPPTAEHTGRLLAVDAQPDNSVGRKRFWEGTFLFADTPGAGPGFKAFRPLVRDGGTLHPLANRALAADPRFAPWSDEQASLAPEAFYAHMAALIDPAGVPPERAYEATLDALVEQLESRVRSVDAGESWAREHPQAVIPMPEGAAIFETTGPWEDYATPSRDLRLLIAMRVLEDVPARIVRHPELFVLAGRAPVDARAAVERLHAARIAERSVTYTRSDGSPWTLTVADVLARADALEVAYDPNDCVERRWGAAPRSPEEAPCTRHAPAEQRARMERYRSWFHEGRRPTR